MKINVNINIKNQEIVVFNGGLFALNSCRANTISSLHSAVHVRGYKKSAKFDLILTKELEEIIVGLILGDLFAEKRKESSNTRLQFKQSIKNKVYIDHLYFMFENYCLTPPKINISKETRVGKKEFNESIKF
jgi:hypothetical protein